MGLYYFLLLFLGIFLVVRGFIKTSVNKSKKVSMLLVGTAMMAFSLFMFQDGSAEIVDALLKSVNINI